MNKSRPQLSATNEKNLTIRALDHYKKFLEEQIKVNTVMIDDIDEIMEKHKD